MVENLYGPHGPQLPESLKKIVDGINQPCVSMVDYTVQGHKPSEEVLIDRTKNMTCEMLYALVLANKRTPQEIEEVATRAVNIINSRKPARELVLV